MLLACGASPARSRRQFLSLMLGSAGLAVASCRSPRLPIRIGANPWPGYEPLHLAAQRQYYGDYPIEVIDRASATEVSRSFRNGEIEVAALTLDEVYLLLESGMAVQVLLVTNFSNGGDVLLAQPSIRSLTDLRGKRVGAEVTAVGAYMLTRALESAGLSYRDISVVPLALGEHEAAFRRQLVDAIVTFDPVRSKLIAEGAKLLFDSSKIPGEIVDVLVARQATIEQAADGLRAVLQGWFRSLDDLQTSPQAAIAAMATRQGVSTEVFAKSLQGIEIPDLAMNRRLLAASQSPLLTAARKLERVMIDRQLLKRSVNLQTLLTDRLLPSSAVPVT